MKNEEPSWQQPTIEERKREIAKIDEMLGREIKPTEAVSGTQAYGELSIEVGTVDQQERYTVMTDISKRNIDGEHCYSGSPIMYLKQTVEFMGHKMEMPKTMNPTVITDMLMVLKVRLEKEVLAMESPNGHWYYTCNQ